MPQKITWTHPPTEKLLDERGDVFADGVRVGSIAFEGISWTLRINGKREGGLVLVRDIERMARRMLKPRQDR